MPSVRSRLAAGLLVLAVAVAVAAAAGPGVATAQEAPSGSAAQVSTLEQRLKELQEQLAEVKAELAALEGEISETATAIKLAELQREIEILTQEIEKLKIGEAAAAPSAGRAGLYGVGPAASKVYGKEGLSIGGYGEALYQNFSSRDQSGQPSLADDQITLLRAVIYLGYKFDPHFVLNTEVEYENAVVASDKGGEAEVEFAYIDYMHSRAFNVRAGLMLIPMGLINELHEPTTFPGARRPDVEQLIIPSTWRELGVGAYGDLGAFAYRAYVVNGLNAAGYSADEGIREGSQEGSEALARNWAFTGRVDYVGMPGLLAGASIFTGDAGQGRLTPSGRTIHAPTTVWDLHADWRWRGLWLRGLYARTHVGDAARIDELNGLEGDESVGSRQQGWYLQAAFDLLSLKSASRSALLPYVRYERYDTQARVPDGFERNPENDVREWTLGIEFKPIDRIVVKADWQQRHNAARTGVNQWNVGLGYIF